MKKVVGAAALAALLVAGCGGSGDQTVTETVASDTTETNSAKSNLVPVEALSRRSVKNCLRRGGAIVMSSESRDSQYLDADMVLALGGKSGGRIGIMVTRSPYFSKQISREFAEEGRYETNVTPSQEAVVVFDATATPEDEALASECAEPS